MSDAPDSRAPSGAPDSMAPHVALPWPEKGEVVLETRGLCRELGAAVKNRVLEDVNLRVHAREFLSVTGFSGSGKSTLLYLLGALDRPTSGSVELDGVDISELDDDARAHLRNEKLGFVFQFHFLLPEFNVLENVMIPMLRRGQRSRREIEAKARDVLTSIGLGDLLLRRPHQLSGGQQQRVSIARAVANDPRIVLADEPTGNLDSKSGRIVMDVFETMVRERGITVIMVTHEQSFAARTSRQISMQDGRIVSDVDQRVNR
ncbi:MAG: ABC transporter ATP-binding protein [Myxococcota bacterium]